MRTRNREQTMQQILHALQHLLLEQGFTTLGVNSIARQAGCDKVLIYRYFNGFEGLLSAFADITPLWWELSEIITEPDDGIGWLPLENYLQVLLKRHIDALQAKPLTLEILAWEMSAQNNLTTALARIRTERGIALVKKIRNHYQQPNIDIGAILGIFGAAINYLAVRTRRQTIKHRTEEWWRLEQTISQLLTR